MHFIFISSKDADEEQVIHLKSNNIEVMTYDNTNDIMKEVFESPLSKYQIGLETLKEALFKRGGLYIEYFNWIKNKKATINPKKKMINVFNVRQQLRMFEKNNSTIALNVLYIKEMEIYPTYISKMNLNCEKQIILLMVPNEEEGG